MKITQSGNVFHVGSFDKFHTKLPEGLYTLNQNPNTGQFFLTSREGFSMPPKIYGESKFPARTLSTFKMLSGGMSVLMSGPKGCGKTVEAKMICNNSNMPVIVITHAYDGEEFTSFVESIQTPTVFLIDEFEKTYLEPEQRNMFLSVMDGVAKSRHLFILTSNNDKIGEFFTNRPGRVRYHKKYTHLPREILIDVIEDYLIHKDYQENLIKFVDTFGNISMDALTSLIQEINLHNEFPTEFISFFNIERDIHSRFSGVMTIEDFPVFDGDAAISDGMHKDLVDSYLSLMKSTNRDTFMYNTDWIKKELSEINIPDEYKKYIKFEDRQFKIFSHDIIPEWVEYSHDGIPSELSVEAFATELCGGTIQATFSITRGSIKAFNYSRNALTFTCQSEDGHRVTFTGKGSTAFIEAL